jgi:hypothetical protein
MRKSKSRSKKAPKRVLALPDFEYAETAVVNSLSSASGQRTYEHAISRVRGWYCSEPRLAFIARWCSGTGSTSNNADTRRRRSIFGWPPFAASRTRPSTPVS